LTGVSQVFVIFKNQRFRRSIQPETSGLDGKNAHYRQHTKNYRLGILQDQPVEKK
jgi:hypothetical protein